MQSHLARKWCCFMSSASASTQDAKLAYYSRKMKFLAKI